MTMQMIHMTLNDAVSKFLLSQQLRGNRPKTVDNYTKFLHRFSEYLSNKPVDALTIDDVNGYHMHLRTTDISAVSLRTYMVHVRAFLVYLFEERLIDENIVAKMRVPKAPKKLHNILTDKEVLAVIETFDINDFIGSRNMALFLLMVDCGLRKGEVESLKTANINFEKGFIMVTGKGGKERIVPLGATTQRSLLRYLENREDISCEYFFVKFNGEPFGSETMNNLFRRLRAFTGIKRLHPHLLRHTFATNFLINGLGDVYELSRILGHSELGTTQIYVNIANNYMLMEKKKRLTFIDILYVS